MQPANAVDLVARRPITAEGSLASALVTPPHRPECEGDTSRRYRVSA
jgi:hypothetical protein